MSTLSGTALADYGHPVFQRDGYVCVYCGFNGKAFNHWRQLSVDHIRPKSAGGSDSAENLVTACNFCNSATSRMKFKTEDSDEHILKTKKEYIRSRLKLFQGFWSDKVDNKDEVPTPEQGGPCFPVPFVLKLGNLELTDEQFLAICSTNENLRIELTAKGELVIVPPTGDPGSFKETRLSTRVDVWAMQDGTGVASGPSGGFRLPNGAVYAPDVSWVVRERLEAWRREREQRPEENRGSFPELCPDFVLVLRSSGDTLANLQRKMEEYMENGARLAWLIDPINRRVHIYRPEEPVEILDEPEAVAGGPVLPGFVLNLQEIW